MDFAITAKRPHSVTAVCIAGEARAGAFPSVFERTRAHLLEPLAADAFMVTSRAWSVSYHKKNESDAQSHGNWHGWEGLPEEISLENQTAMLKALQPIAHVLVQRDTDFPAWLQHDAARAVAADIVKEQSKNGSFLPLACRTQWPLGDECLANPEAMLGGYTMSALRWRTCLALIDEAERLAKVNASDSNTATSGATVKYTYVLRMRPDFLLRCRLELGWPLRAPLEDLPRQLPTARWFWFYYDFAMFMPRRLADVALRLLTLASEMANPNCAVGLKNNQLCVPCLMVTFGFHGLQLHLDNVPGSTVSRACTDIRHDRRLRAPCPVIQGIRPMDPQNPEGPCAYNLSELARQQQSFCRSPHDPTANFICSNCRVSKRLARMAISR